MNKYFAILNHRTVISIIIAIVTLILVYKYKLYFDIDLILLSIAIIFPLVFNIRGSFRRREKALEHLSQFRGALKTIHYFFMSNSKLPENDKQEISNILLEISNDLIDHLSNSDYNTEKLDKSTHGVFEFIMKKNEFISRSTKEKIFRFLNDLHEAIENLNAIHVHRTPISLKAYCEVFIYIFPLIYAPPMIYKIGIDSPKWVVAFVVIVSEFILVTLYNIQDQLEYPFDRVGLDDIKLNIFKFDR